MISSTELILWGLLATFENYIYKVSFGNTAVSWASKMICPQAGCAIGGAEFILSSDSLTLYSFFLYDDGTKLYFATLSVSSGTATLRFKSTIGAGTIQGAALSGDYIVGKRKQIIYMNK